MKLELRKKLYKYKRVHHLLRCIMYNTGILAYRKMYKRNNYEAYYAALKDSKKGKRCFIIGNGPSLNVNDLEMLIGEDCFSSNEIHKIFGKTTWRPNYYMIMGRYSKTTPEQLAQLEIENVYLSDYYCRFNTVLRKKYICFHVSCPLDNTRIPFSNDISKKIYTSETVSFGLMQLVAYMGYSQVYLIGFDHLYNLELDKNGNIVTNDVKQAHFFDDKNEDISNVIGMTKAYMSFRKYASQHNIQVFNCTRGGKLEVFERERLENVLK